MIRKINSNDKIEYINMACEFYTGEAVMHDIPKEYIEETFKILVTENAYADCYISEDESGKINGYMLLAKTYSQEAGGIVIWVEELFVKKESRGKKIGNEFIQFLLESYPVARFRLEVEPENERAVYLYKKYGFSFMPYHEMFLEKRTK